MEHTDSLEQRFAKQWLDNCREMESMGIPMTRTAARIREKGALASARQCLSGSRLSDGFDQLEALSHLELSLEALAVTPAYTALFTDQEANEALARLCAAGYGFRSQR